MREKIAKVLQKIYGITLMISFFAGVLPLCPFIVALIMGGGAESTAEKICTFLKNDYYPWVIALASVAILIGLVSMYFAKQEAFSTKSFGIDKKSKKDAGKDEKKEDKAQQ